MSVITVVCILNIIAVVIAIVEGDLLMGTLNGFVAGVLLHMIWNRRRWRR